MLHFVSLVISICLFVSGVDSGDVQLLMVSGLFTIATAISELRFPSSENNNEEEI